MSSRDVIEWFYLPRKPLFQEIHSFSVPIFQAITGIPKPDALEDFNASDFAIRFAEKLYDYPYWLQDLSHLPLFLYLPGWLIGFLERLGHKITTISKQ